MDHVASGKQCKLDTLQIVGNTTLYLLDLEQDIDTQNEPNMHAISTQHVTSGRQSQYSAINVRYAAASLAPASAMEKDSVHSPKITSI